MATVVPGASGPDAPPPQPFPPLRERTALVLWTWIPATVMVLVVLPLYVPMFDRMRERQPLPPLTEWATAVARLGTMVNLAGALALVALLVASSSLAEEAHRGAGRVWYSLAVVGGAVAFFAALLALVLPMFVPYQ